MTEKVALITGITGQDGSYLTELLLEKGYVVHGIVRRSLCFNTGLVDHIYRNRHETCVKLFLHHGDLSDAKNLERIIAETKPDEIYNLGAMTHVKVSFDMPEYTADCNGLGVLRLLDAIRATGLTNKVRFYQASSSELFGKAQEVPQSETTPFCPRSPYGVAKLYAYWIIVNYREAYGMHLSNGIMFNHESPRRGGAFVTRKITTAVAKIVEGQQKCLYLGNIDAKRDWGYAKDFVGGMWCMLQQENPDDYVLATGETHTVREFVEIAFSVAGIKISWKGPTGTIEEIGVDVNDEDRVLVRINPEYFRPTEVDLSLGDPTKAKNVLGWEPTTSFYDLVKDMVESDLAMIRDQIIEDSSTKRPMNTGWMDRMEADTEKRCKLGK